MNAPAHSTTGGAVTPQFDPHRKPLDGRSGVPHAAPAIVRLEQVSKTYGSHEALHDLNLTLHAGEVFAFLGPNGAGKTTTLKITTGLLRPDRGLVQVCGHLMDREGRLAKQHLAYVPDQPFIYDKLTGREFISFSQHMYGVSDAVARQRLERLTEQLDMHDFLDLLCETYSHGMKQRVALAAALIHGPRLLVVDEPMVGLDPRTMRVIKQMFREHAVAGGAVFMSTHTLDIVEQVADRIGIIRSGRLIALGTLAELRAGASANERLEDIFLRLTGEAE